MSRMRPDNAAFTSDRRDASGALYCTGLSKREYVATAALQGLLADSERRTDDKREGETCAQATARLAVEHADALIDALNR